MGTASRKLSNNSFLPFPLIWLDATIDRSKQNFDVKCQLQRLSNHLKTFTDSHQCECYIRSLSPDGEIVLIVSGHLGQIVIPRIHQLRQISSIYVFCMNKEKNERWSKQFKKVSFTLNSHRK